MFRIMFCRDKGELSVRDDDGNEVAVTAHVPEYWPTQTVSKSNQQL